MWAAKSGTAATAALLLDRGVDPAAAISGGWTVLLLAA